MLHPNRSTEGIHVQSGVTDDKDLLSTLNSVGDGCHHGPSPCSGTFNRWSCSATKVEGLLVLIGLFNDGLVTTPHEGNVKILQGCLTDLLMVVFSERDPHTEG